MEEERPLEARERPVEEERPLEARERPLEELERPLEELERPLEEEERKKKQMTMRRFSKRTHPQKKEEGKEEEELCARARHWVGDQK